MVFRIFTFFIGARVQGPLGLVSYCCSKCVGQREWTPSSAAVILTITARTPQKPLFPFFSRLSPLASRLSNPSAKYSLFADAFAQLCSRNIIFAIFVENKSMARICIVISGSDCCWKNSIVWYHEREIRQTIPMICGSLFREYLMKELPKRSTKEKRGHIRDRYYGANRDADQFRVRDGAVCCSELDRYRPPILYLIFIDTHLHGIYSDIFARRKTFPIRTHTFSYYFQEIEKSLYCNAATYTYIHIYLIHEFKFDFNR